ncbi:MAG: helix-turn-helix domain-containing protein [Acidimicrobiales bacterium]
MEAREVLREVRQLTGLTQQALAELARTTQSTIAAYETGAKHPTTSTLDRIVRAAGVELSWAVVRRGPYRPMTLADLAASLSEAASDQDRRLLTLEFLQEFESEPPDRQGALIADRPRSTGDERWDALVAGFAEHLAFHHQLGYPRWAEDADRFLDRWWFPVDTPSARAAAFVHAPAALARRGVFIERRDLVRV